MPIATKPRPAARRLLAFAPIGALLLGGCFLNPANEQTLKALNADRAANRLGALGIQTDAQNKAQKWAERLAKDGYLHHSTLSDGISVRWCALGENVGYGPSIADIEKAYMNSPGHRANILSTKWNGVGVGVVQTPNRVYTVQVFIKTC